MPTPRCDGLKCDYRETVDEYCSFHGTTGRALWAARHFATLDPDIDWPSDKHDHPIHAILDAFDAVREQ